MLLLSHAHHAQIIAAAQNGYPDEVCGFLLGLMGSDNAKTVQTVLQTANHAERKENRFVLSPDDVYQVDKAARQAGQSIVGVFHSHPDAPATPSEIDRQAAWLDYSYLIVSVYNGQATDAVSWVLSPGGGDNPAFVQEILCLE